MPRFRSAIAAIWAALSASACARTSSTTKSLPRPFILRKRTVLLMDPFSRDGATLEQGKRPAQIQGSSRNFPAASHKEEANQGENGEARACRERRCRADHVPEGPGQHARAQGSKPGDEANDAEGGAAQMLWRHRRDERREHPLCEAHLQSPQANADKENNERLSETDQEIGRDQATRPRIKSGRAPILS